MTYIYSTKMSRKHFNVYSVNGSFLQMEQLSRSGTNNIEYVTYNMCILLLLLLYTIIDYYKCLFNYYRHSYVNDYILMVLIT